MKQQRRGEERRQKQEHSRAEHTERNCNCPYPNYVMLNGSPIEEYANISITEYANIINTINRQIYLSKCTSFSEIRIRVMDNKLNLTELPNSIRVFTLGSNYARRITEFLG